MSKENVHVNHKRVQKLMSKAGLIARGAGKRYKRNIVNPIYDGQNILNRVFKTDKPNKIWVGDITYIHTKHGFLYLAVFIDIFSRKVVGWSMDTRIKESLVVNALGQAIDRERPKKGLMIHTDRGAQFTSKSFIDLLKRKEFVQSYSRKGNPYDNAVMESFYRTLKRELVRDARYEHPEQAKKEIFKYIELYYNTKRMHSTLNYMSPIEFENSYQI